MPATPEQPLEPAAIPPEGGTGLVRGAGQTEAIGRTLATRLRPGDVLLLDGEVGAGKSTLIRAAMRQLGVSGPIPSPTFTLGRLYQEPEQRLPVAHLDLYRLGDGPGEDPGLLSEYFGPDRVTFVEWPRQAGAELPAEGGRVIRITIEHLDPDSRMIRIELPGD